MDVRVRRFIFYLSWVIIVLLGPFTVFINSNLSTVFSSQLITINFFQRMTGLAAFSLLFIQVLLGNQMSVWLQTIGAKAYKFHVTQGIFAYGLILVHPLFEVLTRIKLDNLITILLPDLTKEREIWIGTGKLGLLLLTVGVIAGYFRIKPIFRKHWRAFHFLNYFAFYSISIHSWFVGSDVRTPPFVWLYWVAVSSVTLLLIYKFILLSVKVLNNARDEQNPVENKSV